MLFLFLERERQDLVDGYGYKHHQTWQKQQPAQVPQMLTATPTLLLINPKGRVLRVWEGELPPSGEQGVIDVFQSCTEFVFHADGMGLKVKQIPWDRQASYRLRANAETNSRSGTE